MPNSIVSVEQAEVNIANCTLTSPFTGQIARVHMIPGGYALPGQPVVTVQMMDPMKTQGAVSPETDKKINFNDRVRVYLADSDDPFLGYVYLKDTYADPATRTYLVTLLVRNQKMTTGIPEELRGEPIATTQKVWRLRPGDLAEVSLRGDARPAGFYVPRVAILSDGKTEFIFTVSQATTTAKSIDVRPFETIGQSQRVEAVAGSLQPGDRVILVGAHYVMDGEQVSLVEESEILP